ncbi:hypothetical protein L195_g062010, partial [Trifolium pratense]
TSLGGYLLQIALKTWKTAKAAVLAPRAKFWCLGRNCAAGKGAGFCFGALGVKTGASGEKFAPGVKTGASAKSSPQP